jgi:hypothetical protein
MTTDKKPAAKRTKKEIIHHDIIGREIPINSFVVFSVGSELRLAKVIKLTPKMVRVRIVNAVTRTWYNGEHTRYPQDVAVLPQDEYLTLHLIKTFD